MTSKQIEYYYEMIAKDRFVPIIINGKVRGFITYFIGGNDSCKYIRNNPWSIVDDEPTHGTICYIDQCISNKSINNAKYSMQVFNEFIGHIRRKFPRVHTIRWNRFKNKKLYIYHKQF